MSAPYHPEINGMAERLVGSLKDRLHHINKDQKFNLQRNLNIAVSAFKMEPQRATGFSCLCYSMGVRQLLHTKFYLLSMRLKNCTKKP